MGTLAHFLVVLLLHTGLMIVLPLCNIFRCAVELLCFFFAAPFALIVALKHVCFRKDADKAGQVVTDWANILSCCNVGGKRGK